MPTNAALTFAGIEAELADLFGLPVYRAKRPVAGNKPPLGGWNPGWQLPCFVVSISEPEAVDAHGSFEEDSVGYAASVEYCKTAAASTAGAPAVNGTDPLLVEDEDVRVKRDAVRGRLYKPRLGALPAPIDVLIKPAKPYDAAGTGGAPVLVSGQLFTFEVGEPRPE